MITFLTRLNTASEIEKIIRTAKREVVLVSPFLKLSENNVNRLNEANERGVQITLIYGKDKLPEKQQKILRKLNHLEVYYYEHLHAKCYYNEEKLIITSMNLHEYSEQNNVEMGVLVTSDESIYAEAKKEIKESLLRIASKENWALQKLGALARSVGNVIGSGVRAVADRAADALTEKGYCIRCGDEIPYNPDQPFCNKCYASWSKWGDANYTEKVCHRCRKPEATSRSRPQCYTCYKKSSTG